MPLFSVRRVVGDATKDDVDASAFRAIVCSYEYPGMKWHQSYWDVDRKELHCIYEANSAEEIFAHAERSKIPCDEVRLVTLIQPETYVPVAEVAARN